MRVVDRKTFLTLPRGTIYAKGSRWAFEDLCIKGDTMSAGNDWSSLCPAWVAAHDSGEAFARLEQMLETGASYPMEESYCRDGCYEDDAIFLIFERADLIKLRGFVDAAIYGPGATDRTVLDAEEETLKRAIAEDNLSLDEMVPDALDEARGIGYRQGYRQGLADAVPDKA